MQGSHELHAAMLKVKCESDHFPSTSPNTRYLNIFSGFVETWPGCGWQHSAFKKVLLLRQQKRLGFFF